MRNIELNFFNKLHKKTRRDYLERMTPEKPYIVKKSKKYGRLYWDGDRKYGYGGYYYDGRWKSVAKKIINKFRLSESSKIFDIGCGKCFLLYEIKLLLPKIEIYGLDISKYALKKSEFNKNIKLIHGNIINKQQFPDKYFDLILSFNCLHNLEIFNLIKALKEIERISKSKYIVVESYRNEFELQNLQCWALTAETFFSKKEWQWIFDKYLLNYYYEFIYFENAS